jgi:hypothetical protein
LWIALACPIMRESPSGPAVLLVGEHENNNTVVRIRRNARAAVLKRFCITIKISGALFNY